MKKLVVILAFVAVGLVATQWGVFVVTPMERQLFYSQKVFYYHVANAFLLFGSVFGCGLASVLYLRTRKPAWDDVALVAAEIGALAGAIVLTTGSIWARAAWGHWWVWETRLLTSLLLWLLVVSIVLVRRFGGPGAERIAAGLAVFACVGVPFIYMGVKSGDLHPQAQVVQTLDVNMRLTFWGSVVTFALWASAIFVVRRQGVRAERVLIEIRERALDLGVIE